MRGNTRTRRVGRLVTALGGLVRRHIQRETVAIDLNAAHLRHALDTGAMERYCPPLSCYRSVRQRALSVNTTFLSTQSSLNWGQPFAGPIQSLLEQLLTDVSGAPPIGAITPVGGDSLRFWDANGLDRAKVVDMVMIGIRVNISASFTFGGAPLPALGANFNTGQLVNTLKDYVRDYVALEVFNTADDQIVTDTVVPVNPAQPGDKLADPWFGATPLRYFTRPDEEFVPVPPLLWRGRDPNARILVLKGQEGPGTNPFYKSQRVPMLNGQPTGFTDIEHNVSAQLSIMVSALFVPSPSQCGNMWPGELCPTHKIGNHPDYNRDLPVFAPPEQDFDPPPCIGCGCSVKPAPPDKTLSILDPRFNLREAAKQMLLLEDHIFNEDKWCPDCVQKHCLMIEALGEEGVTLDTGSTEAGELCAEMAQMGNGTYLRLQAGDKRSEVGDALRAFRKRITKALRRYERD